MVAGMYDASLDAYSAPQLAFEFRRLPSGWQLESSYQFENMMKAPAVHCRAYLPVDSKPINISYRHFPHELTTNYWGYQYFDGEGFGGRGGGGRQMLRDGVPAAPGMNMAAAAKGAAGEERAEQQQLQGRKSDEKRAANGVGGQGQPAGLDLSGVSARKNLNETAFFFPHLVSDAEGGVKLEFTMPEALTKWKFLAFAHDTQLRGGLLPGQSRHGQGPDGPAESAAVPP